MRRRDRRGLPARRPRRGLSCRRARPAPGHCRERKKRRGLSNAVPPSRMSRATSIGRRWLRRSASSRLTPTIPPSAASATPSRSSAQQPRPAKSRRSRQPIAPRLARSRPVGPKSAKAAPRSASASSARARILSVLPDPFDAGFAVKAAIIRGSFDEVRARRPSLTMTDAAALESVRP